MSYNRPRLTIPPEETDAEAEAEAMTNKMINNLAISLSAPSIIGELRPSPPPQDIWAVPSTSGYRQPPIGTVSRDYHTQSGQNGASSWDYQIQQGLSGAMNREHQNRHTDYSSFTRDFQNHFRNNGTIGREYQNQRTDNVAVSRDHTFPQRDDSGFNSSSPATSSPHSNTCFRCEERIPNTFCMECEDLFCHECCFGSQSLCQRFQHTLTKVPPNSDRSSPNQVRCEIHPSNPSSLFCETCLAFICQSCTEWNHKEHRYSSIQNAFDYCRLSMARTIQFSKENTRLVKNAMDQAVAITKALEKDAAEAMMKVRKTVHCLVQAMQDHEKNLLEKIERIRLCKINELSEQMCSLRGILAGLAHTNETLIRCMNSEGAELFQAKDRATAAITEYGRMFNRLIPKDDGIAFLPIDIDLWERVKNGCDVVLASELRNESLNMATAIAPVQPPFQAIGCEPIAYPHSSKSVASSSLPALSNSFNAQIINSYNQNNKDHFSQTEMRTGEGRSVLGARAEVSVNIYNSLAPAEPEISFGREGSNNGQISRPWGLCIDRHGDIIVADRRNNRIQKFSITGEFRFSFGTKGTGNGEFELPAGITTDKEGRIIVVDKDNHRVQIFLESGVFVLTFGSQGRDCGQFQYPWDVAVNTIGQIVVSDTRNHRVQLFTSEGVYVTKFVFEGCHPSRALKAPSTPRGVCFTTTGNIIVTDFENNRLMVLDGKLNKIVHCMGRLTSGYANTRLSTAVALELNRPSGIVTDDRGRIVVADSKNHRILILAPDLSYLGSINAKSSGLDDKDRPCDVAITLEGKVVVLFETLPDSARDIITHGKTYLKVYGLESPMRYSL